MSDKLPPFFAGQRVRHDDASIRRKWENYLLQGEMGRKSQAKDWHDAYAAERGTVTECGRSESPVFVRSFAPWIVTVKWDHGPVSKSLDYCVVAVTEGR